MARNKEEGNQQVMAGEKKTRNYRSKDERKAEILKKIKYHKDRIENLQIKLAAIERGRRGGPRQKSIKRLINDAKLTDMELLNVMALGDEDKIRAKLQEIIDEKAIAAGGGSTEGGEGQDEGGEGSEG